MKTLLVSLLFFVSLASVAQRLNTYETESAPDTIYVSDQAKSYLLFDGPVTLADVGNPSWYQAQIEGNSVLVVASKDSVADTPFYAVVGGQPFTARLVFRPHPEAFYDFRQSDDVSEKTCKPTASQTKAFDRMQTLLMQDDLRYANARQNGIRFQLVGLMHDLSTTYLKFKVENHTSLVYQTDFIGFERLKRYKKGFFAKDQEARFPLTPVAEWRIDEVVPLPDGSIAYDSPTTSGRILPYSETYFCYALPLPLLERKEAIIATLHEQGSTRSVSLKISSRLIRRADLY
jgi:hypothetical protein